MGWIGNILLVLSVWLVGSKKRICFVFGFVGNLLWLVSGIEKGMHDLVFISLIMVIFNARAWFNWGQDNKYWNDMIKRNKRA